MTPRLISTPRRHREELRQLRTRIDQLVDYLADVLRRVEALERDRDPGPIDGRHLTGLDEPGSDTLLLHGLLALLAAREGTTLNR